MKIAQLRYFISTVDLGSVSRAADLYMVSQPTVTTAIRNLEDEFGLQLFSRSAKKLIPTKEGDFFYERAKEIVRQVDRLDEEMKEKTLTNKRINIGIPSMVGSFLFPKLVASYKKNNPEVEFSVYETTSLTALSDIETDKLDMGIISFSPEITKPNMDFVPLFKAEFEVVCNKNHKFAKKGSINVEDLDGEQIILFTPGSYQNKLITKLLKDNNVNPIIFMYSSNLMTVRECLKSDDVCAFLYKDVIPYINEELVPVPLNADLSANIGIVFNRNSLHRKDVKHFINFCVRQFNNKNNQ